MRGLLLQIAAAGLATGCSDLGVRGDADATDVLDVDSGDLVLEFIEDGSADDSDAPSITGIGSACSLPSDCVDVGGDVVCLVEGVLHSGGYCSIPCESDLDCGSNALCIDAYDEFHCHLSCESDDDCVRAGYNCWPGGVCLWGYEL